MDQLTPVSPILTAKMQTKIDTRGASPEKKIHN